MEKKYTKGPWKIDPNKQGTRYGIYSKNNNSHFVDCWALASLECQDEGKFNAALIAAAPDLLEALLDLIDCCDGNYTEAVEVAKKAISKALSVEK